MRGVVPEFLGARIVGIGRRFGTGVYWTCRCVTELFRLRHRHTGPNTLSRPYAPIHPGRTNSLDPKTSLLTNTLRHER